MGEVTLMTEAVALKPDADDYVKVKDDLLEVFEVKSPETLFEPAIKV